MPADPQRYCLDCGYNLGGLSTHRCPECGRAFDPHDTATSVLACAALLVRSLVALLGPNEAVRHRSYFLAAFLITLYPTTGLIWLGMLFLRCLLPT